MLDNVTVIIPAHNRPERLQRLLDYYEGTGIHILVPDSSDKRFEGQINAATTTYIHRPRLHFLLKIKEVIPMISTPYVLYCADDDFAVPSAIKEMADFLDANPDYSTAQGHYLTFTPGKKDIEFLPRYIRHFDSRITADTPLGRLSQKQGIYASLLYAVVRTDVFREIYSYCFNEGGELLFHNLFLAEEFFHHAMLIEGKYATLPYFYSARERIKGSATSTTVPVSVIKTSAEYREEYRGYLTALANLLATKEKMSSEEAMRHITAICEVAHDSKSVTFKRKVNAFLSSHRALRLLEIISEKRYAQKGLRATRGMESYPCRISTPEKEAIIAVVRSTK